MYSGLNFEQGDTALQTQDLRFEPRHSGAEHAASWSQMLRTMLNLYERVGKKQLLPRGSNQSDRFIFKYIIQIPLHSFLFWN